MRQRISDIVIQDDLVRAYKGIREEQDSDPLLTLLVGAAAGLIWGFLLGQIFKIWG